MLIQLLALLESAEHIWKPIGFPISLLPHDKSCQECSSCIFSWCFCMSGFGPVQNQEIQRFMKGKIMGEALKEVLFLRKQGVFKSLPKAVEWTIPWQRAGFKKNLSPPTAYGPIILSCTPRLPPPDRIPVPQIVLNFLGAPCSKRCPALLPLASTSTPLVSRHRA